MALYRFVNFKVWLTFLAKLGILFATPQFLPPHCVFLVCPQKYVFESNFAKKTQSYNCASNVVKHPEDKSDLGLLSTCFLCFQFVIDQKIPAFFVMELLFVLYNSFFQILFGLPPPVCIIIFRFVLPGYHN